MFVFDNQNAFGDRHTGWGGHNPIERTAAINALQQFRRSRNAFPFASFAESDYQSTIAAYTAFASGFDLSEFYCGVWFTIAVEIALDDLFDFQPFWVNASGLSAISGRSETLNGLS